MITSSDLFVRERMLQRVGTTTANGCGSMPVGLKKDAANVLARVAGLSYFGGSLPCRLLHVGLIIGLTRHSLLLGPVPRDPSRMVRPSVEIYV